MDFDTTIKISLAIATAGVLSMAVWVAGKLLGIIHSPVWVQMIPYVGGIIAIVTIIFSAGKTHQKLSHMDSEISKLNSKTIPKFKSEVRSAFKDVRSDMSKMDSRLTTLEVKMDYVIGELKTIKKA